MRFTSDERKRKSNLRDHCFDFRDSAHVFEGPTFTSKTIASITPNSRFVTLGFLGGVAVSVVHTEAPRVIHIISLRRATSREEEILFKSIEN